MYVRRFVILSVVVFTATIMGSVGLVACGGSAARAARYASSYPQNFDGEFMRSCVEGRVSHAMCECAIPKIENATNYQTLVQGAVSVLDPTRSPAWWEAVQLACRRHGAQEPRYVAPASLTFLLPGEPGTPFPASMRHSFLKACASASRAVGSQQHALCACVLKRTQADMSLRRFAEDEIDVKLESVKGKPLGSILRSETSYCVARVIEKW